MYICMGRESQGEQGRAKENPSEARRAKRATETPRAEESYKADEHQIENQGATT